jgi:hypothetical protein
VAANQIQLNGTLTQLPSSVVGTTTSVSPLGLIPAFTRQVALVTTPSPKQSAKCGGGNKTNSSAYGTYVTLSGLGATDDVTTADFLYLKTDAPMQVQLTLQNLGGSGTITSVVPVYGMMVLEFPPSGYLTGLSVAGAGDVEYMVSGPA